MMDAFVTRTKRKLDTDNTKNDSKDNSTDQTIDNEESTDVKLAILASLHPTIYHEDLLDILIAHDGDVKATSQALNARLLKKPSVGGTPATQLSLRSFAVAPTQSGSDSPPPVKRPRLLSRKGATLHLYDPVDVSEHTPCTLIHNFLPPDEADALLRELLDESKTFEKPTFKLFDNVVSSPHTSRLYVGTQAELQEHKNEYFYNGARMTNVGTLTPHLERVKQRVQDAVNREIQQRIRTHYGGKKLKYQDPGQWTPNAAFVNCYDGPQESVGWHSDQLTYLGPRPVIGSLSLGVTREFRVRRIVPIQDDDDRDDDDNNNTNDDDQVNPTEDLPARGDLAGQIAIHLPHNSLLVMHADMQEEWKHSVAPARAVDPHPVAGNRRINITYRYYRPAFHPRTTPRCPCGVPAVLRVANRKKRRRVRKENGAEETWWRYFWMCHAGNVPGKETCKFFRWAEFDEDGNPLDHKVKDESWKAGGGGKR